jgi:hypothetical protein
MSNYDCAEVEWLSIVLRLAWESFTSMETSSPLPLKGCKLGVCAQGIGAVKDLCCATSPVTWASVFVGVRRTTPFNSKEVLRPYSNLNPHGQPKQGVNLISSIVTMQNMVIIMSLVNNKSIIKMKCSIQQNSNITNTGITKFTTITNLFKTPADKMLTHF